MKRAKLYGIGIGPGDPRLLTFKAVDTLRLCDVVAVPEPDGADRTAFQIVEHYLDGKTILPCGFSMQRDERKRIEQRENVGKKICEILETEKSVGFVTLGDPMIYSTYTYVLRYVLSQGFEAETIPGVTSFSAAAAALNRPLCEGNEMLHIIPAGRDGNIEKEIDLPGTKVVMKSGKNMSRILEILRNRGLSEYTSLVSRCTMDGERIFENLNDFGDNGGPGYFSVLIVHERTPKEEDISSTSDEEVDKGETR